MSQEFPHTATYSPQDDKIRLYFAFRIDKAEWNRLKALGFSWCMKQKEAGGCDMAAVWSVRREDAALELAGEIDDEDQPREERAAQRAERFEGYQGKREGESHELATRYENTPSIHGHQNAARAERSAARHDRLGVKAGTQWNKAEYWQRRTAGVISHALYQERADVRHRRIKGIEAEIRKEAKEHNEMGSRYRLWVKIATLQDVEKQNKAAYTVANTVRDWSSYQHPTDATIRPQSLYDLLTHPTAPITGAQAAKLFLDGHSDPETWPRRWKNHLEMRIQYENQMLAAQGGTAANIEIKPGGFFGKCQVQKISKDRAGRISKVYFTNHQTGRLMSLDAENCKPEQYREPTTDEMKAFESAKDEGKAGAPKQKPLLNPTKEAAQALVDMWNKASDEKAAKDKADGRYFCASNYNRPKVLEMTAAEWTANTKRGDMFRTSEYDENGKQCSRWSEEKTSPAFRLRIRWTVSSSYVVVLTDKPQTALPVKIAKTELVEA